MRWHFGDRLDDVGVCPFPETVLTQVHGTAVVVVSEPGSSTGVEADALVTTAVGAGLAIRTADCAPVLFAGRRAARDRAGSGAGERDGDGSIIGAAHAGWRGLYEGVIERTVATMRALGAVDIEWRMGPCISPESYEFSPADLTTLALRFGPDVVAATGSGSPALDLPAAVRVAVAEAGLGATSETPPCTATARGADGAPQYFSWRARGDGGRQMSRIWIEP